MGWVKSIFAIPYNALHFDFSEKRAVPNADKKLLENAADLFVRRWQHRRSANQESYSASPGIRRKGGRSGARMEPGGKGSFQAFKLQRPTRTTVCSHSTRDMAASRSIQTKGPS
jgi:hypothetical protein